MTNSCDYTRLPYRGTNNRLEPVFPNQSPRPYPNKQLEMCLPKRFERAGVLCSM